MNKITHAIADQSSCAERIVGLAASSRIKRPRADCNVTLADRVESHRLVAKRRVGVADIAGQGLGAERVVKRACGVGLQRSAAEGIVPLAHCVPRRRVGTESAEIATLLSG